MKEGADVPTGISPELCPCRNETVGGIMGYRANTADHCLRALEVINMSELFSTDDVVTIEATTKCTLLTDKQLAILVHWLKTADKDLVKSARLPLKTFLAKMGLTAKTDGKGSLQGFVHRLNCKFLEKSGIHFGKNLENGDAAGAPKKQFVDVDWANGKCKIDGRYVNLALVERQKLVKWLGEYVASYQSYNKHLVAFRAAEDKKDEKAQETSRQAMSKVEFPAAPELVIEVTSA